MSFLGEKMNKIYLTVMVYMMTAGCAQTYWENRNNPSANLQADASYCENEAMRVVPNQVAAPVYAAPSTTSNTSCMRMGVMIDCTTTTTPDYNAQNQQASAQAGANLGTAFSRKRYTENCLRSRGWTEHVVDSNQRQFQQNQQPGQQPNVYFFKEAEKKWIEEYHSEICESPNLSRYFQRTACYVDKLTLAHLSDTSKITENEKVELDFLSSKTFILKNKQIEYHQIYLLPTSLASRAIGILNKFYDSGLKNRSDLNTQAITWGEYNVKRKVASEELRSERSAAFASGR
jgi:hypothetical protein